MNNSTLKRLFEHMAWANRKLFSQLADLPEETLQLSAWDPEWTVGKIANHIVIGQGRYISRLQKVEAPIEDEFPLTSQGMKDLVIRSYEHDNKLIDLIDTPEEKITFVRFGETLEYLSSTVLAQSIYHAIEHRAQIVDTLAFNNVHVIRLDDYDHWAFERSQKN
jgi:uncharacterized damage-inducible protein DinB